MTASELAVIVSAGIALAALIVSYLVLRASIRFRSELSLPEQIGNVPDFYVKEYLDRQFSTPIRVGDSKLHTLKEARELARKEIRPIEGETAEQARERFLKATLDLSSWQNKFAYELSLALNRVGAAILAGAIPLELVLALNGDQIIDDWVYCLKLIKERIQDPQVAPTPRGHNAKDIYYHRRHAEWLAYTAAIWLSQNWEGGHLRQLDTTFGDIETMRKHERELRQIDSTLIPKATQESLRRILNNG